MGGSASIEIRHTHNSFVHVTDTHFQELLSSKQAREKLFDDVANYSVLGQNEMKEGIDLLKLIGYFTNNANALYPGFHINVDALDAAFNYTIEKFRQQQSCNGTRKSPESLAKDKITKALFHSFLPTLLFFSRIWDIFSAADKVIVEDQRVFKGEFMRIKDMLNNVHSIVILGDITDEEWDREFELLDKNKDGFITFEDTCTYALAHIKKPFDYSPEDDATLLDEDDVDVGEADPFASVLPSIRVIQLAPEISAAPSSSPPAIKLLEGAAASPQKSPRANSARIPVLEGSVESKSEEVAPEEGGPMYSARIVYV